MARMVSSMGNLDIASLLFSLPDGIVISSVRPATTELVVHIACRLPCAACPLCQQPSERVHGTYVRTVADLPCAGRRVIFALKVRKFVCSTPACPRQIFTERLPELVQSYARMTNRLRDAASRTRFSHQRRGESGWHHRWGCSFRLPRFFVVCVRTGSPPH